MTRALAPGTRWVADVAQVFDDADDVLDAEFVDVPAPRALAIVSPQPVVPPGRARRITDAYTTSPVAPRPVIAIA